MWEGRSYTQSLHSEDISWALKPSRPRSIQLTCSSHYPRAATRANLKSPQRYPSESVCFSKRKGFRSAITTIHRSLFPAKSSFDSESHRVEQTCVEFLLYPLFCHSHMLQYRMEIWKSKRHYSDHLNALISEFTHIIILHNVFGGSAVWSDRKMPAFVFDFFYMKSGFSFFQGLIFVLWSNHFSFHAKNICSKRGTFP